MCWTTGRTEGFLKENTQAGYVHLHWGRTPEAARHFVQMMRRMRKKQDIRDMQNASFTAPEFEGKNRGDRTASRYNQEGCT